jgi:hypothetical protein
VYATAVVWRVLRSRFKVALTMRQTCTISFGTKLEVKYWQAKHENRECCPQHGALSAVSAGLAFSAVTIAVSEPFLLPGAENWCSRGRIVPAPGL